MKDKYNFYNIVEPEEIVDNNKDVFILYPATSGLGTEIGKDDIVFGNKKTITSEIKLYPIKDMVRVSKSGETERYWLTKDNIKTILDMEVD